MTVVLIDTSVFCNIIGVPEKNQRHEEATGKLGEYIEQEANLLLPMATILETGNHIAHAPRRRHETAERFAEQVRLALDGKAPWAVPKLAREDMRRWIDRFPREAAKELSLADLSIIEEWQRQRDLFQARRVLIWSYDNHLAGRDRPAPAWTRDQ